MHPRRRSDPPVESEGNESTERDRLRPTAPPSPHERRWLSNLHDDELLADGADRRSTTPPSLEHITSLDAPLVLPEHAFYARLDDFARRFEILTALLQTDGLSRVQGSRALQAALAAIAAHAEEASLASVGALVRSLRSAVGELVPQSAVASGEILDVVVVDAAEISRDFVSLAVEAKGHIVRSAGTYDQLVTLLGERLPDIVIADTSDGRTPARQFCATLAALFEGSPARLMLFSALPPAELPEMLRVSRAAAAVSKELGLRALLEKFDALAAEGHSSVASK